MFSTFFADPVKAWSWKQEHMDLSLVEILMFLLFFLMKSYLEWLKDDSWQTLVNKSIPVRTMLLNYEGKRRMAQKVWSNRTVITQFRCSSVQRSCITKHIRPHKDELCSGWGFNRSSPRCLWCQWERRNELLWVQDK